MYADTEIASGYLLGEESEILCRHTKVEPLHLVLTEEGDSVVVYQLCALVVVEHIGIAVVDEEVTLATHTLSYTAAYLANLLVTFETPFLIEGANDTLHLHLVGDNVGASASDELAERECGWHHRSSVAAHNLLQSHDDAVQLLPALPSAWKDGSVKGLRARGNYTVDIDWEDGRISGARILSGSGGLLVLRTPLPVKDYDSVQKTGSGITVYETEIETKPNKYYTLNF